MSKSPLKSLPREPGTEAGTPAAGGTNVDTPRRVVAADASRSVPPVIVRQPRRTVLINVKVNEDLAIALAKRADAEGVTQKQVIMRALAVAGLPVDPLDLEDRSPRRRATA